MVHGLGEVATASGGFEIRGPGAITWQSHLDIAQRAFGCFDQLLSMLGPIPRVLHSTFKVALTPSNWSEFALTSYSLRAFARHNPSWKVELSTDAQMDAYLEEHLEERDFALLQGKHAVERSDVWRRLKLHREGGAYMDVDRGVNVDFDTFLTKDTRLVVPTQHGFGGRRLSALSSRDSWLRAAQPALSRRVAPRPRSAPRLPQPMRRLRSRYRQRAMHDTDWGPARGSSHCGRGAALPTSTPV